MHAERDYGEAMSLSIFWGKRKIKRGDAEVGKRSGGGGRIFLRKETKKTPLLVFEAKEFLKL
jgi:hypothetical protein